MNGAVVWELAASLLAGALEVLGALPRRLSIPAVPPRRPAPAAPGELPLDRRAFFEAADPSFPDLREVLGAGARVLDLGCGRGRNLDALAAQGFRAVGLDLCSELLGSAHAKPRSLLRADMRRLPLADASVDAVVAWQALCQFPLGHAALAFAEIHRVLAAGGVLVFSGCYGADAWGLHSFTGPGVRLEACPPELLEAFETIRTDLVAPLPGWPFARWVVYARKPSALPAPS